MLKNGTQNILTLCQTYVPTAELKENMRRTKNNVLEINKMLLEVQPLVAVAVPAATGTSLGTDLDNDDLDHDDIEEEEVFHDAVEEPMQISMQELAKSVSDFLEICLQELYDL